MQQWQQELDGDVGQLPETQNTPLTREDFRIPNDPMRDIMGSAMEQNLVEYTDFLKRIEEMGVELNLSDESLGFRAGYGPSSSGGVPGVISIETESSLSAILHELQHAIDDYESGYQGMRILLTDIETRIQWERNAYNVEIEIAINMGRQDIASYLELLFQEEVAAIIKQATQNYD